MGEWFEFYNLATFDRIVCGVIIVWLFRSELNLRGEAPTCGALAWFIATYTLSLCVFFARQFLPPEWADIIRDVGVGLQAISLTAFTFFLWRKFR